VATQKISLRGTSDRFLGKRWKPEGCRAAVRTTHFLSEENRDHRNCANIRAETSRYPGNCQDTTMSANGQDFVAKKGHILAEMAFW